MCGGCTLENHSQLKLSIKTNEKTISWTKFFSLYNCYVMVHTNNNAVALRKYRVMIDTWEVEVQSWESRRFKLYLLQFQRTTKQTCLGNSKVLESIFRCFDINFRKNKKASFFLWKTYDMILFKGWSWYWADLKHLIAFTSSSCFFQGRLIQGRIKTLKSSPFSQDTGIGQFNYRSHCQALLFSFETMLAFSISEFCTFRLFSNSQPERRNL